LLGFSTLDCLRCLTWLCPPTRVCATHRAPAVD